MGFSLKKAVGGAVGGIAGATLGSVFRALSPNKVSAPGLPATPTLNEYGAYPEFSPQELQYLQQQQQALQQYQTMLNQQPTSFDQSSDQIGEAENRNYLEALNQGVGALTPLQLQQQKKDFAKLVQSAGRHGIRILGDDPATATSDSTAGNQILSDFNQRYQIVSDQNRQAQLQMGGGQNLARLGFNQNRQQANYANILNLGSAYGNLMQPYQQQRTNAYGVQNANVDIRNQGLLNNYQSAYNQQMLNYQANAQNEANRMGFINSLIGLGGTIGGAALTRTPQAAPAASTLPNTGMGFGNDYGYVPRNRLSLY